jgi:hypothetical protein
MAKVHGKEQGDAAIQKVLMSKALWIASLRSQ